MKRQSITLAAIVLASTGLLAACGDGDANSAGTTSSPASATSTPAASTSVTEVPSSTVTTEAPASETAPAATSDSAGAPSSTPATHQHAGATTTPPRATTRPTSTATSKPTTAQVPTASAGASARATIFGNVDGVKGRTVTISYGIRGTVRGKLPTQPLYTDVTFGDGEQIGSDGGEMTCSAKDPVNPIRMNFGPGPHTYAKPGTYTITFATAYCGDKGGVKTSTTRTVTIK